MDRYRSLRIVDIRGWVVVNRWYADVAKSRKTAVSRIRNTVRKCIRRSTKSSEVAAFNT